ncbi:MAG: hypothetical protein ACR2PO_00545, partial [Methyloligellaceae bacterium]
PETRSHWAYPDTCEWDADRNTQEFVDAMPDWLAHGVLAFTINLQGGSPYGYSKQQPWINSAIEPEGGLRADYLARLKRILDEADALGMAVILGLYYFGQEKTMNGEAAIARGVDNAVDWVLEQGYRNVLIEINNECNVRYQQLLLMPDGVHELIEQAKSRSRDGRRLLVGTSHGGGFVPKSNVVTSSDFLLIHGNHITEPTRIRELVCQTRKVDGYRPMPVLFNEDDHFDFDKPDNNFLAALDEYASWGYFDYRKEGEAFDDGYQSVPVNWRISSERKRGFFELAKRITTGD